MGLSPKIDNNRIIYAMRVDEILPYERYYQDSRFRKKIPDFSGGIVVFECGDNIYRPLSNGSFQQLQSMHSNETSENPKNKIHDLGGKNVLISETFYYFGSKALELPDEFSELIVDRAHKCRFSQELASAFVGFISNQRAGVHALPTRWPSDDDSGRMAKRENFSKKKRI